MREYDQEKWVRVYKAALVELEHSLMAGRLADARPEIVKRLEILRDTPGVHKEEQQAIEDALNSLRSLEREHARYAAEEQRNLPFERRLGPHVPSPLRILVADDNETITNGLCSVLEARSGWCLRPGCGRERGSGKSNRTQSRRSFGGCINAARERIRSRSMHS